MILLNITVLPMNASTKGVAVVRNRSGFQQTAFTLVELLVVIATIAVLAVMLLPALAGTQAQSKVTACTARYRQWAVSANLYANDNRGWLPSFNPAGGGTYAWDVGTNMCNALYPYGMDVPVWFCPVRGREETAQPIQNLVQLTRYFGGSFAGELIIDDNYWVPRASNAGGTGIFPVDFSGKNQAIWPVWLKQAVPTSAIYGWPQRLHDIAAAHVPFVSDSAGSGQGGGLISPNPGSPSVSNISPNTAHFVNGRLIGVNLAFVDGHVESHSPLQMKPVYQSVGGGPYWFY
jgi:prepilin-type processing-associated H-X9-DG protein